MRIQVIPNTELAAKLENVIDAYKEQFPQVEPRVRPFYPCSEPIYGKLTMTFLHNFEQLDYEELILFFQRYETIYYEFSRLHIYLLKTDALFYERNGKTS